MSFQRKFRIWVFLTGFEKKTIAIFEISFLEFSICEVSCKNKKYLRLGQKMLDFGIFRLEFEKFIVIFKISALEFVSVQTLGENKNP